MVRNDFRLNEAADRGPERLMLVCEEGAFDHLFAIDVSEVSGCLAAARLSEVRCQL
jgi:hypothetical protein